MLHLVKSESSAQQMLASKQLHFKPTFRGNSFYAHIGTQQLGLTYRVHKYLETSRIYTNQYIFLGTTQIYLRHTIFTLPFKDSLYFSYPFSLRQ